MILSDLAQVIYAPKKAFKSIVANPKYLGVIIVLILFMAFCWLRIHTRKTNVELTEPAADSSKHSNASSDIGKAA